MQCSFNIQYFILGWLIRKQWPSTNDAKNVNRGTPVGLLCDNL